MTSILLDPQKYPFAESHSLKLDVTGSTGLLNITLRLDEQMVFQQAYALGGHFPHRNYPFAIEGIPCYLSVWGSGPGQASINVVVENTCVLHWG